MIGLHCETCDLPLFLTVRMEEGLLTVNRLPYTECTCPHSPEELVNILLDAYQDEDVSSYS